MAEGKRSEEWVYWSEMLALTANCHRNPKKQKPFTADVINPYRANRREKRSVKDFITIMRSKYDDFGGRTNGIG